MSSTALRAVKVGERIPDRIVGKRRIRRLEAAAIVIPGRDGLTDYLRTLAALADDFAAWDGRVVVLEPDGEPQHRVVVIDRYGQVYEAATADDSSDLPSAHALEEWFRFLATACPECGVLDDPRSRDWTP